MIFERGNWMLDANQQWTDLFEPCNWYDFTVIRIDIENDKCMGAWEASFWLLGFGVRIRWNHTMTE